MGYITTEEGGFNVEVAAAGGCTYPSVTQSRTTADNSDRMGSASGTVWASTPFTTAQEYSTKIKVQVGLKKVGTPPAGVITAFLSLTSGSPNYYPLDENRIQADATIDGSAIGTSEDYTTCTFIFTLANPLPTATIYALFLQGPGYTDTNNCWNWMETNGASTYLAISPTGISGTWGNVTTSAAGDYKVYSCN